MELSQEQLFKEWTEGTFRPAYLLIGEAGAQRAALERIKEILAPDAFNLDEFLEDSPGTGDRIVQAASAPPLNAARRLVLARRPLGSSSERAVAEYLQDPLETTTLVLVSDARKPDLKLVLHAAVAALRGLAHFRPLDESEAAERLRRKAAAAGAVLDEEGAALLVSEAGTDMAILEAELEKALCLAGVPPAARPETVVPGGRPRGEAQASSPGGGPRTGAVSARIGRDEVLACLGYRQAVNPFALTDAIVARDARGAVRLLRRLADEGSEPIPLLYSVARTLNKQLKAKRLARTGADPRTVKHAVRGYERGFVEHTAAAQEPRLRSALRACLELEVRLKSHSWLDPFTELERLVLAICKNPRN